jgi:hypothetical protein
MSRLQRVLPVAFSTVLPHVYQFVCKGKGQVIISLSIAIVGVILSYTQKRQGVAALLTFGSYFVFLIGIAAVTILANSMTVGFLVYYFQSAKAGRNYYYDKFREAAAILRDHLDSLYDDGLIGSEYDESYREIELLTMERLPVGWKEIFLPFLEELFDELRDNLGPGDEYDRIAGNLQVKLVILNEAVSGLWVNLVQRVVMRSWVSPVLKSFWTLALTIFAVIVGAIYFVGASAHILAGLAIGIGCMTILLILEIRFIVVAESQEFFDDKRDVDHSRAETHTQVSQEEIPQAES